LQTLIKEGCVMIAVGVVVIFCVADGLVAAITSLGTIWGISSFFLSMAIVPVASNASELITTLSIAAKRRKKSISMLFSMLYGGVVMNNAVSLATFLLCLVVRGLQWNFAAETISLIIVVLAMGSLGSCTVTYLTAYTIPALLAFPLAIGLVPLLQIAFPPTPVGSAC